MKQLPRWIGRGVALLLIALLANSFWQRWSSFKDEQPGASVWVFAREESVFWAIALAIGVGLMLVGALNDHFDRMSEPHLGKLLPYLVVGLSLAVIVSAILIWIGSTWAPLSIAVAIGFAVHAAKAAGLGPKPQSNNLPPVEG
jgi:hypothetical protein